MTNLIIYIFLKVISEMCSELPVPTIFQKATQPRMHTNIYCFKIPTFKLDNSEKSDCKSHQKW